MKSVQCTHGHGERLERTRQDWRSQLDIDDAVQQLTYRVAVRRRALTQFQTSYWSSGSPSGTPATDPLVETDPERTTAQERRTCPDKSLVGAVFLQLAHQVTQGANRRPRWRSAERVGCRCKPSLAHEVHEHRVSNGCGTVGPSRDQLSNNLISIGYQYRLATAGKTDVFRELIL
jgi:hypothetical protein